MINWVCQEGQKEGRKDGRSSHNSLVMFSTAICIEHFTTHLRWMFQGQSHHSRTELNLSINPSRPLSSLGWVRLLPTPLTPHIPVPPTLQGSSNWPREGQSEHDTLCHCHWFRDEHCDLHQANQGVPMELWEPLEKALFPSVHAFEV